MNVPAYTQPVLMKIKDRVCHELSWAVKGNVPAPFNLVDGHFTVPGIKKMVLIGVFS